MKHALVVGSNSMLGRELAALLAASDTAVIRCGRTGKVDVRYDLAGLAEPPAVPASTVDVLFFCAASFADDSWDGCLANALINTAASYRIAQWAAQLQCPHIVMAGSVSSCPEFTPSSYGLSKAHGEEAMQFACARRAAKFTAVRFPQLCDERAGGVWQAGVTGTHPLVAPESHSYRALAEMAFTIFARGGCVVDAPEMKPFRPVTFPPASPAVAALIAEGRIPMRDAIARIQARGSATAFTA
jgi:hypothetical protein